MRSRRSSRPSWSSSAFTFAAAVSLRLTLVASGACVSCTVMLCPPRSEVPERSFRERVNAAAAELLPMVRRAHASAEAHGRAHVDLPVVKLRLPARRTDETTPGASADLTEQLERAGGKGRPTPKRSEAQGRRQGPPPPPPTTRKEAYRRMRSSQAANRGTARAAAARGDDSYLPARDRGPARRLVRNVVDGRRNVGSLFLLIAALALVSFFVRNAFVQTYTSLLLMAFFLFFLADSVFLARRIKRTIAEKLPNESPKGAVWYGVSRSTMIRRWRFPKPEVDQA